MTPRVADVLAQGLLDLGVRHVFGMTGGAIAPLAAAMNESALSVMHFRHETGAAFAATEVSLASGRPTAVFTTTGPGLTNALTGLAAARWEGAKVILLSATTPAAQRGRWAFQETSSYATPYTGLFEAGQLFHFAASLESPEELQAVFARLALGCSRQGGFVANLGVPIRLSSAPASPLDVSPRRTPAVGVPPETAVEHARLLSEERVPLWVGFGARHAAREVRALAEKTGAGVFCTPRGKGIFPESHPQFVGVTGMGGHASVREFLEAERPSRVLVLGTRMGEFSSLWDARLVPPEGFVHVDLDPDVPGVAFPHAPVIPVIADVRAYLDAVLPHVESQAPRPLRVVRSRPSPSPTSTTQDGVRPEALLSAMQRVVVEGSEATVITEAGNAFAWGTHALHFDEPRYRVSMGFGSMGHATAGVLGIALGSGKKAVALVGDGALLMQNEIHTAVTYGIPVVWVVLNDGRYGMIDQGMRSHGLGPVETLFPPVDFVEVARAMGADGVRVTREDELVPALEQAMRAERPFVVDVAVDPRAPAPINDRVKSLMNQERGDS